MEHAEIFEIKVGEKMPVFQKSLEKMKGRDGAVFEASEFNQGYNFFIHLANISFMEKHIFQTERVHMRVLQGSDGLVLPMMQFGKTGLMFEILFDPTLYDDNRSLQFTNRSNILTMILIESTNGIVKAIRQCNLPLKMIQICKEAWAKAILDPEYRKKHNEWAEKISRYPLQTLWSRATKVGELGESYNLEDIKIPNQYKPNKNILWGRKI